MRFSASPAFLLALLSFTLSSAGQAPSLPGQANSPALFPLNEMDFHLHSGMERPVDLKSWIDMAVHDGRKIAVLVDHLELYRKSADEYEKWRSERRFQARYPLGPAGHTALAADFDQASKRTDIILLKGWEVSEDELDSGLEDAPLRMADMLGFHISPHHVGAPPDGKHLIRRARQLKEIQKRFPVPMVLFHPFPMRLENLQRRAKAAGRPADSLTVAECRFFQPGEQEELAAMLRGTSIYIEISSATAPYMAHANFRQALIEDIKPLVDLGVQFSVSTDHHSVANASKSFHPETYCDPLGITPRNTNTIARELLALRARRSLAPGN